MSIITLQLGQCGNQVGFEILDLLARELDKISKDLIGGRSQHGKQEQSRSSNVVSKSSSKLDFIAEMMNSKAGDSGSIAEKYWSRFFRVDESGPQIPIARACMIDMEPKVVQITETKPSSSLWRYPKNRQFIKQGGSGNNWAFG